MHEEVPGVANTKGGAIDSMERYRETLAEIRRLRSEDGKSEDDARLAELEGLAADYAERLRSAELRKGRPDTPST